MGATLMNQDSSRSHSVFSITIETIQQGPASVSAACFPQHQHYLHWLPPSLQLPGRQELSSAACQPHQLACGHGLSAANLLQEYEINNLRHSFGS